MIDHKKLVVLPMLLLAHLCWAEENIDIPGPAICASQEAMECEPVDGCHRVSLDEIHGPQFISLKPGDSTLIVTLSDGRNQTSTAERREKVDGKFIFQGSEEADAENEDGVGWTMLVAEDTGRMTLTVSSNGVAWVIFGACTLL